MKSNMFSKTVKKTTLWAVIIAVILAAAIVVCALFGFNKDVTLKDAKTLTVSVNTYHYDTGKDEIKADCEKYFKADVKYVVEGKMSGDECEMIFVFDKDADLTTVASELQGHFANKISTDEDWKGAFINVSASSDVAASVLAKNFVLRAAIAATVFAVLAIAYVAIRFKSFNVGLVVGVSILLSMLLTTALIILTRVYVTTTSASVIAVAGLFTAVMTLMTLGKIRTAQKEDSGKSNEEIVANNVAVKEILSMAGAVAIGMLLVGILGKTAAAWFAVSAILGIAAATFVSLFFAPAMYLCVKSAADKKPAKDAYVGAKKTSAKKQKKAVAAPVEETPVEETVEEAPVEETVEEAVEETPVEETTEEAPVEAEE